MPTTTENGREGHSQRVASMFGRIAGWYDFLNHFLSLGLDVYWRHRLVRLVRVGSTGRVLDLAAGTLDVARKVRRQHPEAAVLGLDLTLPMLRQGQAKLTRWGEQAIFPVGGDATALPLAPASVDCVTLAFGIRNIPARGLAYAEIFRVLAPGGRLCILEFGSAQNRIWKGLYNFYLHTVLPLAGRCISKDPEAYAYLARTIQDFPPARLLAGELAAAGFDSVGYIPLQSGIVYLHIAEKSGAAFAEAPAKDPAASRKSG